MSEEKNRIIKEIDPDEYRDMKMKEKSEVFDMLSGSTQSLMKAEDLLQYLDLQSRFMHLSVSNVLLIKAQRPEAVWVRTFDEWKQDNMEEKDVRRELGAMKQTAANMEHRMLEARQKDRDARKEER